MEGHSISSIQTLTLELPPSCIEFCPAHPDYLVVGTYNLVNDDDNEPQSETKPKPQERNGSLLVFRLRDRNLTQIQRISQPSAVLDLHFGPGRERRDQCAVVSSTGTISLFKLSPGESTTDPLSLICTRRLAGIPEDVLFLSCAWNPASLQYGHDDLLAITTSAGEVCLLSVEETESDELDFAVINTHSDQAWVVAIMEERRRQFEDPGRWTIFSGGDDSVFNAAECTFADLPHRDEILPRRRVPIVRIKGHRAGVTSILPLPLPRESVPSYRFVVTGSFDEYIRVYAVPSFDQRSITDERVVLIAEKKLGGGVWRMRAYTASPVVLISDDREAPTWEAKLLVSCMHSGARLVRIIGSDKPDCRIDVLAQFTEHESMNYGSDFQPSASGLGDTEERLCVSTSFYDKRLCLWQREEVEPEVGEESEATETQTT